MDEHTLMMVTRLFLDARMESAAMRALDAERFESVLILLLPYSNRAGVWLRYCCQTMRDQMETKAPSMYDFADTVHNAARLYGLKDGKLLIPHGYWESEMQRFRKRYGDVYFADFIGDVVPDEIVERMRIESHHKAANTSYRLQ